MGGRLPSVGVCRSDPPRDRRTSSGWPGSWRRGRAGRVGGEDADRLPAARGGRRLGAARSGAASAGVRSASAVRRLTPAGHRRRRGGADLDADLRRARRPGVLTVPDELRTRAARGEQRGGRVAAGPRRGRRLRLRAARAVGRTVGVGSGRRARTVEIGPGRRWDGGCGGAGRRTAPATVHGRDGRGRAPPARRVTAPRRPARSSSCTSSGRSCGRASCGCGRVPASPMRSAAAGGTRHRRGRRGPQPRAARRRRRADPGAQAGGAACRGSAERGPGGAGAAGVAAEVWLVRWLGRLGQPQHGGRRGARHAARRRPGARAADHRLAHRARPLHLGRRAGRGERHRRQAHGPAAPEGDAVTPPGAGSAEGARAGAARPVTRRADRSGDGASGPAAHVASPRPAAARARGASLARRRLLGARRPDLARGRGRADGARGRCPLAWLATGAGHRVACRGPCGGRSSARARARAGRACAPGRAGSARRRGACAPCSPCCSARRSATGPCGPRARSATSPTERAVVTVRATVAADPGRSATGPADRRGPDRARAAARQRRAPRRDPGRGPGSARSTVTAPVLVIGRGTAVVRRCAGTTRSRPSCGSARPSRATTSSRSRRRRAPCASSGRAGGVFAAADAVRERFRSATAALWPDARGLVPALVVGDTSQTPPDLTAAMLDDGPQPPQRRVRQQRHASCSPRSSGSAGSSASGGAGDPGGRCSGLLGFVILARPEPSVVRAAVMGLVGLLALSTSRRRAGHPGARRRDRRAARVGPVAVPLLRLRAVERRDPRSAGPRPAVGSRHLAEAAETAQAVWVPSSRSRSRPRPSVRRSSCPCRAASRSSRCSPTSSPRPFVAPTTVVGVVVALVSVVWVTGAGWLAWVAALPAQAIAAVARLVRRAALRQRRLGRLGGAAVLLAVLTAGVVAAAPWAWSRTRHRPTVAVAVVVLAAGFARADGPDRLAAARMGPHRLRRRSGRRARGRQRRRPRRRHRHRARPGADAGVPRPHRRDGRRPRRADALPRRPRRRPGRGARAAGRRDPGLARARPSRRGSPRGPAAAAAGRIPLGELRAGERLAVGAVRPTSGGRRGASTRGRCPTTARSC